MPTFFEIPTTATPQSFAITLAGVTYNMRLTYCEATAGFPSIVGQTSDSGSLIDANNLSSWILDIADTNNTPIVSGIPLITGIDLLWQYVYLDIGGALIAMTDGEPAVPPPFDGMGTTGHLLFVTFP